MQNLVPPFLSTNNNPPAATTVPQPTEVPQPPVATTPPVATPTPVPATPPANTEPPAEDKFAFFKAVEKELGISLLDNLPDDIKDKLDTNVTGVLPYMEAFAQARIKSFEEDLKKKYPKTYEALEYEKKGGNPVDYFKLPSTWSDIKLTKDNTALAEQVILESLKRKGNSEDEAKEFLELYKSKGDEAFYKKAQEGHKFLKEEETAAKEKQVAELNRIKEQQETRINAFGQELVSIVKSGDLGKFKVPQADADKFIEHISSSIIYDGYTDKFLVVDEIGKDNIKNALDILYFRYTGGDIKKMIEREAQSLAAENLRLRLNAENNTPKGGNMEGHEDRNKQPTLTTAIKDSFNKR